MNSLKKYKDYSDKKKYEVYSSQYLKKFETEDNLDSVFLHPNLTTSDYALILPFYQGVTGYRVNVLLANITCIGVLLLKRKFLTLPQAMAFFVPLTIITKINTDFRVKQIRKFFEENKYYDKYNARHFSSIY